MMQCDMEQRETLTGTVKSNRYLNENVVLFTFIDEDEEQIECYSSMVSLTKDCQQGNRLKLYGKRDSVSGLFRIDGMVVIHSH